MNPGTLVRSTAFTRLLFGPSGQSAVEKNAVGFRVHHGDNLDSEKEVNGGTVQGRAHIRRDVELRITNVLSPGSIENAVNLSIS